VEVITDLMDLSDLREAFWSNDLAGDAPAAGNQR
jgi:hypothetical protein